LRVLVERGAGGRQQHHRLRHIGRLGIAGGKLDRAIERAGNDMWHLSLELSGKAGGGLADQIGLADAGKEARERGETTGLRLAAGDPEHVGKAGQCLRGRVRVGRLGIIDEQHTALVRHLLHPVREARKRDEALLDHLRRHPERKRSTGRTGRILRVVQPAQRTDAAEAHDGARGAAGRLHDLLRLDIEPVGQRPAHRDADGPIAGTFDAIGGGGAPGIIDPDNRHTAFLHARNQPFLHRRIVRERAMAIEMVLGDVDQNADRGIERGCEVDLVGRALDHVHAVRTRWLERKDRGPDIATHLCVVAGGGDEMRGERRGGRFAVGAGDRDERRIRRVRAPFAAEQLDIADHLDRSRTGQRHLTSGALGG